MTLISTAEVKDRFIVRDVCYIPTILRRHGIQPIKKRNKFFWSVNALRELVEERPELARPYRPGAGGVAVALGQQRSRPKSLQQKAVVIYTAWLRMRAGIRVGERDRYDEVPPVELDDVPGWVFEELEKGGDG